MIVAAWSVHREHGLFAASNGIEVPLLYGAGAAALTLTGPGAYSLDAALGLLEFWTPALSAAVLVAAILGGVMNLALRRTAPQPVTACTDANGRRRASPHQVLVVARLDQRLIRGPDVFRDLLRDL